MPRFAYQPLDTARGEIRLIRLLPGDFDDEIQVEIFHEPQSNDHVPLFEALSYVWGSQDNPATIIVSEPSMEKRKACSQPARKMHLNKNPQPEVPRSLSVTRNLSVTLRHLRRRKELRILWIDAICINQDDLHERGTEVGRMGLIFSKAVQTIVWLGPASENSDFAMETLRSIGQDVNYDLKEHALVIKEGSPTEQLKVNPGVMAARAPDWKAIQDLLYRPWFTRLWVYQEIKLSQQALVLVGFSEIPWSDFRAVLWWLAKYLPGIPTLSAVYDKDYFDKHISGILQASPSIINCIQNTKSAACFDPKDRVYGALNLFNRDLGIIPDYSITKEEVYKQFARAHIATSKGLDILALCELQISSPSLPSWVPDLSVFKHTNLISIERPSGNSRHVGHFSDTGEALHVMGIAVDTINSLSESVLNTATMSETLAVCGTWAPANLSTAAYAGGGTMMDAFVKILACGDMEEDQPDILGDMPSLEEGRGAICSLLQNSQLKNGDLYGVSMRFSLPGRRFGTVCGGYMGAFPAATQIGDQICIMLGCHTPLLLRPVPDFEASFRLVGHCYIDGVMEGEALLGQLPDSWQFGQVDNDDNRIYVHDDGTSTLEGPRLGPLPSGWRICYEGGQERYQDGSLSDRWFENDDSGKGT